MTEEVGDRADDGFLFVGSDLGEEGQGKDFARRSFGFGKVPFLVAKEGERLLLMQGNGVVDLGSDFAGGEKLAQGIAAVGPKDVLVPDMACAWHFPGQDDAMRRVDAGFGKPCLLEKMGVALGRLAA